MNDMNSHQENLRAKDLFSCNTMSASNTDEIYIEVRKTYHFFIKVSEQPLILKRDIEAFRRKTFSLYDLISKFKDNVLKVILPKVTISINKILIKMAKGCLFSGSPSLASDIYELIGDIHLRASDVSQFRLSGYITLELKSPATFWYLKSDNTSLDRHSINRNAFSSYSNNFLKEEYSQIRSEEERDVITILNLIKNISNGEFPKKGETTFNVLKKKQDIKSKNFIDYERSPDMNVSKTGVSNLTSSKVEIKRCEFSFDKGFSCFDLPKKNESKQLTGDVLIRQI